MSALIAGAEQPVLAVVADMENVLHSDTDGADVVLELAAAMKARRLWFGVARLEPGVDELWRRAGTLDAIGAEHVFGLVREAAAAAAAAAEEVATPEGHGGLGPEASDSA